MTSSLTPWVWLVDDDSDDQLLLKAAFKQASPDAFVHTLDDGDELISQLSQTISLPNLVLLDLNMARMGGFETLRAVRQAHPEIQLPIVILTTSSNSTDQNQAIQQGANAFLSKPSEYGKLVQLTKELAEQYF
jgi:CheY-like chemotaxis protein